MNTTNVKQSFKNPNRNLKRYAVQVSYYLYAHNDKEAIDSAKAKAHKEDYLNDNKCSVDVVQEAPFGEIERRELDMYSHINN